MLLFSSKFWIAWKNCLFWSICKAAWLTSIADTWLVYGPIWAVDDTHWPVSMSSSPWFWWLYVQSLAPDSVQWLIFCVNCDHSHPLLLFRVLLCLTGWYHWPGRSDGPNCDQHRGGSCGWLARQSTHCGGRSLSNTCTGGGVYRPAHLPSYCFFHGLYL